MYTEGKPGGKFADTVRFSFLFVCLFAFVLLLFVCLLLFFCLLVCFFRCCLYLYSIKPGEKANADESVTEAGCIELWIVQSSSNR